MARRRTKRNRGGNAGVNTVLHLSFSDGIVRDLSHFEKKVCDSKNVDPIAKAYKVTSSGDKFYVAEPNGGAAQPRYIVAAYKNLTYEFDFSDSSMAGHQFRLSTSIDGPHEGGSQYSLGWSEAGTPGTENSKATFQVPFSAPSKLYYYCNNHDGMGATSSSNGYIKNGSIGQIGYSTGVYESKSTSAHFSGDAGVFVSGDGYSHAGDLNIEKDFTISFWAKGSPTGHSEDQCLFDFGGLTGFVKSGVTSYIPGAAPHGQKRSALENISKVDLTEWNHFCLMRKRTALRYYINGTGQGTEIIFTGHLYSLSNSSTGRYHSIGCTRNYKNFYSGYIDDFFLHDIAIYGKDGFTPVREDVSGKFSSIAKDGLSAKHNVYNIYLMSDGGYRQFEMYNTDVVYYKLPPTGNIIPKDNTDYTKQYIYPISGQDVILSFYKSPDLINAKDSALKFYCDSGSGRELIATDQGGASSKGSALGNSYGNDIEITTSLKPQNWRYFSRGNIDVNATHLVINNIQPGYTGTWSAEHWEGNRVYSTQRQVIIKDVIAGTGCVRPRITGLKARGQIMSLADPAHPAVKSAADGPTWTGNCEGADLTRLADGVPGLAGWGTPYTSGIYLAGEGVGSPTLNWAGAATPDNPTGNSHYRIFSGWLAGDSLPSFADDGIRYDGSTDNSHIKFIISEEPLGAEAPWCPRTIPQPIGTVGTTNHPTGGGRGFGDEKVKAIYKEFSFAEVSGMPVQTFKAMVPASRMFGAVAGHRLIETSGRLLISGDGNQRDDNAIHGDACMYLTVVDSLASGSCGISNSLEDKTCKDCSWCGDERPQWVGDNRECHIICTCVGLMGREFCCSGECASNKIRYNYETQTTGSYNGWEEYGYSSESECYTGCVGCGGEYPIWGGQSPDRSLTGRRAIYEGETVDFDIYAKRGDVHWRELSDSDYNSCNRVPSCYVSKGKEFPSHFSKTFCKSHDNYWYVPIPTYDTNLARGYVPGCGGLTGITSHVQVQIKGGGDVEIWWPTEPVNVKVKRGQTYNLSVTAQGSSPIYYAWFSGNGTPITPLPGSEEWLRLHKGFAGSVLNTQGWGPNFGWSSFTIGPLNKSACYYAKAWNGGCADGRGDPFINQDTSANICIEVVDQTDEIQCCLDSKTREFQITGSSNCKITSIKGYELWTDLMGSYASDYRHGRIITPEVTSKSDKSWNTKWHQTPPARGYSPWYTPPPAIEKICYNSGTDPNKSQNNEWCSSMSSGGADAPCFTVSGCPDKIVYEITTSESTSKDSYGEYFGGSNRNKTIERKQYFEDYPLGQTGHLYVQYASSADYTGDCGCKHHVLNWTFPPYDNAAGSSNYASCNPYCVDLEPPEGVCCSMGATVGSDLQSFTPDIGQTAQTQYFTGCAEWSGAFTGSLNFIWEGQTPTGLGSYFRVPLGNTNGGFSGIYKGVGAANRNNNNAIFTGDVNMWDIRIVKNTAEGIEGSGSYNYTTHYLSGSSELTFTRTLKENYYSIRNDSNRTLISLASVAPSERYVTNWGRTRTVDLHTAHQTNFIFAVNSVEKTDSHSASPGVAGKNGFTRYTENTELWCHQSGDDEPFKIINGWVNVCYPFVTATTSGACYAAGPGEQDGMPCPCIPNDVTIGRIHVAEEMTRYQTATSRGSMYLDLTFVMESGDVLKYEQTEYSGWNSFCHGHFLAVNQSTGNWKNFTGCAEISPFQTFVNGQEV